jgi:hypothetical protein
MILKNRFAFGNFFYKLASGYVDRFGVIIFDWDL